MIDFITYYLLYAVFNLGVIAVWELAECVKLANDLDKTFL